MHVLNLILSNQRIFSDTDLQPKCLGSAKLVKLKRKRKKKKKEFVQFESHIIYKITIVYRKQLSLCW